MLKISIAKPCHEAWDEMIPNEQGRHCNSCIKTVVDFTTMSDEEVKYFFLNRKEEKTCGRFRSEQLHRIAIELPHDIFYIPMPLWKKFLVASLIVFSMSLFSCDTTISGKSEIETQTLGMSLIKPTVEGNLKLVEDTTISPDKICPVTVGTPSIIVGALMPPEIIKDSIPIPDTLLQVDTSFINKFPEKIGEIKMEVIDSIKTKNPAKLDSINCDTQIYL